MAQLARSAASDPIFIQFVEDFDSISSFDAWVRSRFLYRDEAEEVVRSPLFMLADVGRNDRGRMVQLEGDCDDISTFYGAAATVLGDPARFVAIRYHADSVNFEHVYTQAYNSGRWITLDATVPPGTPIFALEELIQPV